MKRLQDLAIELLAYGMPIEKVGEQVGVAKSTLYRWLKDDEFKRELDNRTREVLGGLSRKLSGLTIDNLGQFESLLQSTNEVVRVKAWGINLARLTEITELARLEDRVALLEDKLTKNA